MNYRQIMMTQMDNSFTFEVIDMCFDARMHRDRDYFDALGMLVFMGAV